LLHDHAGTEEADARHHVGDDLGSAGIAIEVLADVHKSGSAHRHQHMGAQAAAALAVLALGPDQGAEHERRGQADQRVEEVVELE
jgi:hypothetical protein